MSELGDVWRFTRARLDQAIEGLTPHQLAWRPFPEVHSIGEIVYHVAACEHYWAARLMERNPASSEHHARLERAVHDGFLREGASPFPAEEMTPHALRAVLDETAAELEPIMEAPNPRQLEMSLISPIGDPVDGRSGLTRLAQHAGYHTGQIWLIRMMPGFPA